MESYTIEKLRHVSLFSKKEGFFKSFVVLILRRRKIEKN
jgi:hypothetical protein